MNRQTEGLVLLVGEGDFSLSLSLSQHGKFGSEQMISTSKESRDSICKHQAAQSNIQFLQDKGVKIYFEVDARQLHSDQCMLRNKQFSRIVFNFPHSGGKSNHKKNRTLLNDFFLSASKVLDDRGQIMVTLCKGQGGTPADKPMRAWHDSWQVVSMAANSSLILREIIPFYALEYSVYNSVGYRSQDKGFNTDGALIHVFELSDSVTVPSVFNTSLVYNDQHYSCSQYLHDKLNRNIVEDCGHPLSHIKTKLLDHLAQDLHISFSSYSLPCFIPHTYTDGYDYKYFILKQIPSKIPADTNSSSTVANGDANHSHSTRIRIRTSLFEQTTAMLEGLDKCIVTSGLVTKPCVISPNKLPVHHELLIVCPFNSLPSLDFDSFSQKVCHSLGTLFHNPEDLQITKSAEICVTDAEMDIEDKRDITFRQTERAEILQVASVVLLNNCFIVIFNLDKLTCLVHGIDQQRLLWSKDYRFYEQFNDKLKPLTKFQSFYIYPMTFHHDISFWEKDGEEIEEMKMYEIICDVAGDVVNKVELLDRYKDNNTQQQGRCYRFTYVSYDKALSYITSWKLQSVLRLEINKRMGIILR
ncbi:ferredoxin-fold anticodon-binding domain-containing protein 1 homolog [Patella vulgata]|uniref:ferredoxin-fold anticodon-binding domain-containing protein 1 homolog n=1 Tax=Patella vulgata TaxID=6465 RepID=UPI00217F5202|nr:ferredoxin-fold anticodon-binding domain-containing protein 1 homolog [Patella vulgata]